MALRFRRTLKILPGLKLNFGKRGVSVSAGVRGATMTFGKNGLYGNVGLPGTGLSYRRKLSGGTKQNTVRRPQYTEFRSPTGKDYLDLDSEGRLVAVTDKGGVVGHNHAKKILTIAGGQELVSNFLNTRAKELNEDVDDVLDLHLQCKHPQTPCAIEIEEFSLSKPINKYIYKKHFFIAFIIFGIVAGTIDKTKALTQTYFSIAIWLFPLLWISFNVYRNWQAMQQWKTHKRSFEQEQQETIEQWELLLQARDRREELLEAAFNTVSWPRETFVNFELRDTVLHLDVDLPEVEDMPQQYWEIAPNGVSIKRKERSDIQLRKLYARHVHSIVLLAASVAFWAVPELEKVQVSGYTQRPNKATGEIQDDYILSVIVPRFAWEKWTAEKLEYMDPLIALESFEMRRDMTKTGIFKAITPFL